MSKIKKLSDLFKLPYFWFSAWALLFMYYFMSMRNGFYLEFADDLAYGAQVVADFSILVFAFVAYKFSTRKVVKSLLFPIFVSICVGVFANEIYNVLFHVFTLNITSTAINLVWLLPYTIFLVLQIYLWVVHSSRFFNKGRSNENHWVPKVVFLQAPIVVMISILLTPTFRQMLALPYGYIQLANTGLEIILFYVLSVVLSQAKSKGLIYLLVGFLFLVTFNLAHRFSYISGHYFKTFDVAWLICFLLIILGLAYFINDSESLEYHESNSFHVIASSALTIFTTILIGIFLFLEFFFTSLEENSVAQVQLLLTNMPCIIIFAFSIAIVVSKLFASSLIRPIEFIFERIKNLQEKSSSSSMLSTHKTSIYEYQKLEQFVLQTISKLDIANRAKSEFLMNMSHDFRTPASGIHSMSKLLYDNASDEKTKRLQKLVVNSSRQLLDHLDELLEYMNLDKDTTEPEYQLVDVRRLINEASSFMMPKVEEKRLSFDIEYPDMPLLHETDPGMLRKILINLLSNAIKFTEQGGITITASRDFKTSGLMIKVKDTGIGIDPRYHEVIFDPFVKVAFCNASISSDGVGLGLSNAKALLKKLSGKITLQSFPRHGSLFIINLQR